jgi:hypothetical protein
MTSPGPSVWYFAYGSNMQSATLSGRRGVRFRRAVPARAPGWRLVFDKPPLVPMGHATGNILPEPGAETLGVVFEIGAEDLAHIELTEGVLIGNYRRVEVEIAPLAPVPSAPAQAFSLSSDRRDPSLRPSVRYMTLVIAGAVEHGLPAGHVEMLRRVPVVEESAEALVLWSFVDEALRRRS